MNENSRTGLKAHLVGSVPLDDSEAVFRTVSGSLGPFLDRLPDGETGARINWIRFIQEMLNAHPDLEVDTAAPPIQWVQWDGVLLREIPLVKFKDSVDPANVKFDTGYADAAIQSFTDFDKLQSEGVIPGGVRFQICIATPLASGYNYVSPVARGDYLRVFGAHITGEVEKIAAALPNDRIAIQWDVCQEVLMWENYYGHQPEGFKEQIFSVAGQIGDAVPEPVELGYHLCYDSPKDEHLIQPKDMANMVEMTRGIVNAVSRTVQFIHLPVPRDRTDGAYFAPLKDLNLPETTDLYLGLIHHGDGAGDIKRLHEAQKVVRVAGVASECGWGRGDPERIGEYLEAHRALAEAG